MSSIELLNEEITKAATQYLLIQLYCIVVLIWHNFHIKQYDRVLDMGLVITFGISPKRIDYLIEVGEDRLLKCDCNLRDFSCDRVCFVGLIIP